MNQHRYASDDDDQGFEISTLQLQDCPPTSKLYPDFMNQTKRHLTINLRKNKHYLSQKPALRYNMAHKMSNNSSSFKGQFNVSMLMNTCFEEMNQSDLNQKVIPMLFNSKDKDNANNNRLSQMLQTNNDLQHVFLKSKRPQIGQDIVYTLNSNSQEDAIKQEIAQFPNSFLLFRYKEDLGSHSFFKKLLESQNKTFLDSKYNRLLKQRIMFSKYKTPKLAKKLINEVQFSGDFECGNIDFVIKSVDNEYNVFLKKDTFTRGHQGWFYFKIASHLKERTKLRINICNLKRMIKMAKMGQKIYYKSVETDHEWKTLNQQLYVSTDQNNVNKLSFSVKIHPHEEIYLSLIPPYTYTDLLKHVEELDKSKDVRVQILTYSVCGMALPLITITKNAKQMRNDPKKNVILVSARIHPGQTCGSFIVYGLMKELTSGKRQVESILYHSVIKIIPMLNPDGVVFGNFRTHYLGDDLNRSFHHSDELIYPQIIALKTLGKTLKKQHHEKFLCFLDFHGHSCQTNSFVYGPQYDKNSPQSIQSKMYPKILDEISQYFLYDKSNFQLQNYKQNTARAYFLRKLKVPSYTIETSYALFISKVTNQYRSMSTKQWVKFGVQISNSFKIYLNYLSYTKKIQIQKKQQQTIEQQKKDNKGIRDHKITKNTMEIKEMSQDKRLKKPRQILEQRRLRKSKQSIEEVSSKYDQQNFYMKIRKDIEVIVTKDTKPDKKDEQHEQSDAESQNQDLPVTQKQEMLKNIKELMYPSSLYPKVSKPAMILPSVVPAIFSSDIRKNASKDKFQNQIPRFIHRQKQKKAYITINSQYTEYLLKNINNLKNIKPEIVNFQKLNMKKSLDKTLHL